MGHRGCTDVVFQVSTYILKSLYALNQTESNDKKLAMLQQFPVSFFTTNVNSKSLIVRALFQSLSASPDRTQGADLFPMRLQIAFRSHPRTQPELCSPQMRYQEGIPDAQKRTDFYNSWIENNFMCLSAVGTLMIWPKKRLFKHLGRCTCSQIGYGP